MNVDYKQIRKCGMNWAYCDGKCKDCKIYPKITYTTYATIKDKKNNGTI